MLPAFKVSFREYLPQSLNQLSYNFPTVKRVFVNNIPSFAFHPSSQNPPEISFMICSNKHRMSIPIFKSDLRWQFKEDNETECVQKVHVSRSYGIFRLTQLKSQKITNVHLQYMIFNDQTWTWSYHGLMFELLPFLKESNLHPPKITNLASTLEKEHLPRRSMTI